MKAALLVFLIMLISEANAVENDKWVECLEISSFQYKQEGGELIGQCKPSESVGAFWTDTPQLRWECLESWPDYLEQRIKEGSTDGVCRFGHKPERQDVKVCTQNPEQCAPGPSAYWGACMAPDTQSGLFSVGLLNWKCISLESSDIDNYAKGDCLALPVEKKHEDKEPYHHLYEGVCRFEMKKPVKCPTSQFAARTSRWTSACFHMGVWGLFSGSSGSFWSYREQSYHGATLVEDGAAPCEWTLMEDGPKQFYQGECLFPSHTGYEEAAEWPEYDGVGTGFFVFVVFLVLAAGGGGFLCYQRTKKTRPRALSGGLMR